MSDAHLAGMSVEKNRWWQFPGLLQIAACPCFTAR